MFNSSFPAQKVASSTVGLGGDAFIQHIYRFSDSLGKKYLVYLHEFNVDFFTVEFCLRTHRNARNRFSYLTNSNQPARVINTALNVMLDFISKNPDRPVSFGFIGARMDNESEKELSKRFRVYRRLMELKFSPENFIHVQDETIDAYVLISRTADFDAVLKEAIEVFAKEEEE